MHSSLLIPPKLKGLNMIVTTADILGIPVSTLGKEDTIKAIHELVKNYTVKSKAQYVATLNMDFLSNCFKTWNLKLKNQDLYNSLKNADLVTADGMPIVCFAKLNNATMKERVTGADMVYDIAKYAAMLGHKIFYIGESKKLCKDAHLKLKSKFPRLKAAGFADPMVHSDGTLLDDLDLIDRINKSGAKFLFLGLGNPKQEMFFKKYKEHLKIPVSIGIGGSYNFITGRVNRAPVVLQKIGFEWAYRLIMEPSKLWKRYLKQMFLLCSLVVHGRLNLLNFFSFRVLKLKEHWEVYDGSVKVLGKLNHTMVEKITFLINECAFTRMDIANLTHVESGSLSRLKQLCRNNNIAIYNSLLGNEKQKPTKWFNRKTNSLITRVM